jgi:DNA-binding transcriptional LysR family regulator
MRYMTDSLNALRLGEAGHVVIGTLTTATSRLLPDAVRLLRQRHPNIHVSILVGDRAQLDSYLVEGKLDIVIGAVPSLRHTRSGQIDYQALYEDELYVVSGHAHPLVQRQAQRQTQTLRLAELAGYPWIIPPRESLVRAKIDQLFEEAGLALPANTIESLSPLVNIGLLMDQESLTFMSGGLAQLFLSTHMLARLRFEPRCSFGDVGYAIRAHRPPSLATQTFISCLREEVA